MTPWEAKYLEIKAVPECDRARVSNIRTVVRGLVTVGVAIAGSPWLAKLFG